MPQFPNSILAYKKIFSPKSGFKDIALCMMLLAQCLAHSKCSINVRLYHFIVYLAQSLEHREVGSAAAAYGSPTVCCTQNEMRNHNLPH